MDPRMEHALAAYTPQTPSDKTVSFLRALWEFAPKRDAIERELLACGDDKGLRRVYRRYMEGLIIPMRVAAGKTEEVTESSPRAPDESATETIIEEYKYHPTPEALESLVHRRDDFRCAISRKVDLESVFDGTASLPLEESATVCATTHIIPFASSASAARASSSVWGAITAFSGIEEDELRNKMSRLENTLLLSADYRMMFGRLRLCLDPTENPNEYFPRSWQKALPAEDGRRLTLTTTDARLALPDARYLGLHAALCKIMHVAGVREEVEAFVRKMEETTVLSAEGSSGDVLHQALLSRAGNIDEKYGILCSR